MSNTPGALIAMSGGVDSTVAAYLMKQAGCRCMGATMRLYQNEDQGQSGFHTCCSAKDVEDAAEVAFQLDIPFEVVNYTEEFREKVIAKFIETYEAGGTPNPCIDCNRTMKFDKMLDFAREHGLDYVVTGHYARIEQDPATGRISPPMPERLPLQCQSRALTRVPSGLPGAGWTTIPLGLLTTRRCASS